MRNLPVPTRVVVLAGAAGVLALGLLVVLLVRPTSSAPPVVDTTAVTQLRQHQLARHHSANRLSGSVHHAHSAPIRLEAGLPSQLRSALESHRVVVAVVAAPDQSVDMATIVAAADGAEQMHAGFALLDIRDRATATSAASYLSGATDPVILVVSRPGRIVAEFSGYEDATTVAQAVLDAR